MNKDQATKHIFVTGGVASSLGKGLTASSLGSLLRARNFNVAMQKLDPYLNVDPGTMNPFQHGEVFVTEDGAETDLDIGHYERFLDFNLNSSSNVTTGQIFSSVIAKERMGKYLGNTVQIIPHITNEIKACMRLQANSSDKDLPDIIITEIGGTVGDIESQPFLESARQIRYDLGKENVFFLHISLVPYIGPSGELKTKPTQHSVVALRAAGIQPQALVLRSDRKIPKSTLEKIALFTDVEIDAVINAVDTSSIYEIPQVLYKQNLDTYILSQLGLKTSTDVDWTNWDKVLKVVHKPKYNIDVALIGKYVDLPDAYLSVVEALHAGGFANNSKVNINWVASDDCLNNADKMLANVDAVIIPGGFGVRGIEGKIEALKYARENKIPTLGICLGLQSMIIEYARNIANIHNASSTEFYPDTLEPVITAMQEQKHNTNKGGTMRLGAYKNKLTKNSLVAKIYNSTDISERHRHRYEFNNKYRTILEEAGLIFSGIYEKSNLIEFIELPENVHPYYIGTQGHPEFKSRPTKPHPLFVGLIKASLAKKCLKQN